MWVKLATAKNVYDFTSLISFDCSVVFNSVYKREKVSVGFKGGGKKEKE